MLAIWAGVGLVLVPQPVFEATVVPPLFMTVRLGVARTPPTPDWVRPGPSARMRRLSVPPPPMTKPGIRMLAPVPTMARVEMLIRRAPDEPELTYRVAAPLVVEPSESVTVTVYGPPLEAWTFVIVYDEPVAPPIGAPLNFHW